MSLTKASAWKGIATSSVNDKSATDQRVGRAYIAHRGISVFVKTRTIRS